jgi:hypothetical protein
MFVTEFVEKNFDDYTRKARLAPALLLSLPLVLIAVVLFPDSILNWGGILGLIVWFGVLRFVAQIARDSGNAIQESLYASWGGEPSTDCLRHRTSTNKIELAILHSKLHDLTKQIIPDEIGEMADKNKADQIYKACTSFLRANTRDRSKFPLLHEENCNYGFRRNLLGMKTVGIITSFISILCMSIKCIYAIDFFKLFKDCQVNNSMQNGISLGLDNISKIFGISQKCQKENLLQTLMSLEYSNIPPLTFICLTIDILLFIGFLYISYDWVKITAYAYANSLIESCKNLP